MKLDGKYTVYLKPSDDRDNCKARKFVGECLNFSEFGACVFGNENEILLIQRKDIVHLSPNK